MKKRICFVYIWLMSICLCACQIKFIAKEDSNEEEQRGIEEEPIFIEKYSNLSLEENAKRMALIYLDEDSIPELLLMKNGEYQVYTYDGYEVKEVTIADTEIKASIYGMQHDFEESDNQMFYWFEYVPYKGLIRVHNSFEQARHDYYLKYENGKFSKELEAMSCDYMWKTYDANEEIENDEFLNKLLYLGYGKLIPCGFLYEDVSTAYENLGVITDNVKVLEDFVNGKVGAVCSVDGTSDIVEENFVMRSYEEVFEDITEGDEFWGSDEYIDFDNDGEEELIIHGYAGASVYFDVIGDTVYRVITTGGTTDVTSVALFNGKRVVERTDLTHVGRKSYRVMQYDACCCLIDYFHLYVGYEGPSYSEEDVFMFRNKEISMEEFEEIVSSINPQ